MLSLMEERGIWKKGEGLRLKSEVEDEVVVGRVGCEEGRSQVTRILGHGFGG